MVEEVTLEDLIRFLLSVQGYMRSVKHLMTAIYILDKEFNGLLSEKFGLEWVDDYDC